MDDGADARWLQTEDLCGLSTFMDTVNSQKFQLFRNPEPVQNKVYTREKNTYHLISKSNVQKTHFAFFHDFIHTISQVKSIPSVHPPVRQIHSAK